MCTNPVIGGPGIDKGASGDENPKRPTKIFGGI